MVKVEEGKRENEAEEVDFPVVEIGKDFQREVMSDGSWQ